MTGVTSLPKNSPFFFKSNVLTVLLLTSVGHKDFQSSALQKVAPGKDRSDLTKHPLPMQTLGVSQDLRETQKREMSGEHVTPVEIKTKTINCCLM